MISPTSWRLRSLRGEAAYRGANYFHPSETRWRKRGADYADASRYLALEKSSPEYSSSADTVVAARRAPREGLLARNIFHISPTA